MVLAHRRRLPNPRLLPRKEVPQEFLEVYQLPSYIFRYRFNAAVFAHQLYQLRVDWIHIPVYHSQKGVWLVVPLQLRTQRGVVLRVRAVHPLHFLRPAIPEEWNDWPWTPGMVGKHRLQQCARRNGDGWRSLPNQRHGGGIIRAITLVIGIWED